MREIVWTCFLAASLTTIGQAQDATDAPGGWDPSPHQIRLVSVEPNVQLEVLDWGGEGPAMVFLAGLTLNAHSFDDFAPKFTDGYRVYAITRRGHGASSWPESGYSLERLVEDVRVVMDTLRIDRAILVGHSFGGDEMTRFAADHSERVAGLIYVDAAYDGALIETVKLFEVCPLGQDAVDAIERRFENLEAFRNTQRRLGPDGSLVPYISSEAMVQLTSWSVRPDYSRIDAPALAVYHTPRWVEDIVGGGTISGECLSALQRITYEGMAGFAKGMKNGRIVALEDTQHNIHLVSPSSLEEVMRRWLATVLETRQ